VSDTKTPAAFSCAAQPYGHRNARARCHFSSNRDHSPEAAQGLISSVFSTQCGASWDPPLATAEEKHRESKDRPGAGGHRFGPKLRCDECGMSWEAHQRDPHPCVGKCREPIAVPLVTILDED